MAISLSSNTLQNVIRNATFSETINILTDGEAIHSVTVFPVPVNITEIVTEDENIVTTENLNNIVTESSFTTLTTGVTISLPNSTIVTGTIYNTDFVVNEKIVGETSGDEATIITTQDTVAEHPGDSATITTDITGIAFQLGENITGQTSGAVAPISSFIQAIRFSGSYENAYDKDIIQSIPVGQSDKTIKPTISKTFELVPTGHTIFSAIQDDRPLRTAAYQVNIEYGPYKSTFSTIITQAVDTDVDIFQTKLKELYP
tara:strand:- start:6676 stop:7452 length:777 start_codon:yes stop_codon:yes gene_type:complete